MKSSYEKITEKLGDGDSANVLSFWGRSEQAVKRVIGQIRNKIRRTYADLTGQSGEKEEYVTLVDAHERKHRVKKADIIRSNPSMAKRLSVSPKRKVFAINASTAVVQWLVRVVSQDVPPVEQVNFDPAFTMKLYRLARSEGFELKGWLDSLLARQVASDPWECLAGAWKGPNLDLRSIYKVIKLLPSYDVLSFATTVHERVKDLSPSDRLCLYPFGRYITVVTSRGPLTVDFPPFFTFALAINRAIERTPEYNERAAQGDKLALEQLLTSIGLEYGFAWHDTERLGKSSDWIANYIISGLAWIEPTRT